MPMTTIGPRGYKIAKAAASVDFVPLYDRAAIIRRILLTNPSAADTWHVECDGQRLGDYYELKVGNQQLLGSATTAYPKDQDIFQYLKTTAGIDLIYPVPNATTLTVYSDGGATSDIVLEYSEEPISSVNEGLLNHPHGKHKIMPIYALPSSAVAATGETAYASEVKPNFVPSLFLGDKFPPGWSAKILGLFAEGLGVNTYSGAADHLSATDYIALERDGQRMFTRDALGGLPVIGTPAAAGSANAAYGSTLSAAPAFQESDPATWDYFEGGLNFRAGDVYQWFLAVAGDVTGGADYSTAVLAAIVDFTQGVQSA